MVAHALRVPVNNVSALNVTECRTRCHSGASQSMLRQASLAELNGVLGYTEDLLASCDFNHDSRSGIIDANQTRASTERTVNILIWLDKMGICESDARFSPVFKPLIITKIIPLLIASGGD